MSLAIAVHVIGEMFGQTCSRSAGMAVAPDLAASVSHHHRKHQSAVSAIRALILAEQQWDRLRFDADPNVVRGAAAALADAKAALSAEAKP
jgi:hypothetical protein